MSKLVTNIAASEQAKATDSFRSMLRSLFFLYHPFGVSGQECKDVAPLNLEKRTLLFQFILFTYSHSINFKFEFKFKKIKIK